METIGLIGLGNIGSAMAERILLAEYPLIVYDQRAEAVDAMVKAGAKSAASPAEVAQASDIILTSLPGPIELEEVTLGSQGIIHGIRPGSVYVDHTTSRASLIQHVHALFKESGVEVLDAPISGGRQELLQGKQEFTIGGSREALDRVTPVLSTYGDQIRYAGDIGAGTICKLVHNMLMRDLVQIIAEGMTLGVKAGVDAEVVWDGIRRGLFGKMMVLHNSMPRTSFKGVYEPTTYTMALSRKDIGLATEIGRDFNVPMPVSNLVEQICIQAMNRGWEKMDSGVIFAIQEEAAGVEVRAPNIDLEKAAQYISIHPEA
jgi:3-hydroxyisobutyrate dehydrogenase